MADIHYNHHIKLIKLTFLVPFTKNDIFELTKCGLSPKGFYMQCIKTRIEWLKRIIAALTGTCIFGDAVKFINKDSRVLFGDIFIGSRLGIDINVQPGVGKFGCN